MSSDSTLYGKRSSPFSRVGFGGKINYASLSTHHRLIDYLKS